MSSNDGDWSSAFVMHVSAPEKVVIASDITPGVCSLSLFTDLGILRGKESVRQGVLHATLERRDFTPAVLAATRTLTMFDGRDDRTRRHISLGGRKQRERADKGALMRQAMTERAERAEAKRRTAAATRIAAWWRGRWQSETSRNQLRQSWDGQMRDIEAMRSVFNSRGVRFDLPAKVLNSLIRSFLAFSKRHYHLAGSRRIVVDAARFELTCSILRQYPSSARDGGLTAVQCRGLVEVCLTMIEAGLPAPVAQESGWRFIGRAACAAVEGDVDDSPFTREVATLAFLWVGQRSCAIARLALISNRSSEEKQLAIAFACASLEAAKRHENNGDAKGTAFRERVMLSQKTRAAFGLQLVSLQNVDERAVAVFIADLVAICRSILSSSPLQCADDEPSDTTLFAGGAEVLLSRLCHGCARTNYPVEATTLSFAILSRLPRAALNVEQPSHVGMSPEKSRSANEKEEDSDDDEDDTDLQDTEETREQRLTTFEHNNRSTRRSSTAVVLLDAAVAAAIVTRDKEAETLYAGYTFRNPQVALASKLFWAGLFQSACDDEAKFHAACSLSAAVLMVSDIAPRARVAIVIRGTIPTALLEAAALDRMFVRRLWTFARSTLLAIANNRLGLNEASSSTRMATKKRPMDDHIAALDNFPGCAVSARLAPLMLFSCVYSHILVSLDDDAVCEGESHLSETEIYDLSACLRDALYRELWYSNALQIAVTATLSRVYLLGVCARLFNQLYDRLEPARNLRVEAGFWIWKSVRLPEQLAADGHANEDGRSAPTDEEVSREIDGDIAMSGAASLSPHPARDLDSVALSREPRVAQVLAAVPFVVPFEHRVALFTELVERDRIKYSASDFASPRPRALRVKIRRDHVFDDAFDALFASTPPAAFKRRIQVTFVNEAGHEEAGIDGGGVFKEFLDELAKTAFSSVTDDAGDLFEATPEGALYPRAHRLDKVEFCGRIIGKALYERVLVEPRFARFFLNKALGKFNCFDDLASLDRDLYANLLKLKRLPPKELEDLGLNFEVTTINPRTRIPVDVELIPGGKHKKVDRTNRMRYMQLVAYQRINVETAAASAAFLRGLRAVVPARWLRMFDPFELQTLISGADSPIDVDDWMKNVHYSGGYHPSQPFIQAFWDVVRSFDAKRRALLLRFVTSCSRPPLLGFSRLQPLIAIHKVSDQDRLPTSSTCMNLLKLPEYGDPKILREKILYAIEEAHGFELS